MEFVAKKLPNWYCDGEAEGYALLVDGKKFGVISRWRYPENDYWSCRIHIGKITIAKEFEPDQLHRALAMAKQKFNQIPKNVVDKFLSETILWTPEQEQP